jgi:hypothetical protein
MDFHQPKKFINGAEWYSHESGVWCGGGGISIAINKHILGPPLGRPISEAYSIQMAQILLLAHIVKYYRPILIVVLMKISAGVLVFAALVYMYC